MRMVRHFLEIDDLSADELAQVLDLAEVEHPELSLTRRGVALLFEKPSARTRHSMEVATIELGGHPVYVRADEVGLDERESVEDIIKVFAGYHAAIAARVFEHDKLVRASAVSSVPIVNLLSDQSHPIQTLADLLTLRQEFGSLDGLVVSYIGDANNVAKSLALGVAMSGGTFRIAHPADYGFADEVLDEFAAKGVSIEATTDAREAAEGADALYTDAWYSMGQEAEAGHRRPIFAPYQVDEALMGVAKPTAVFLHCLPAHRNDEATDAVLDGPQSRIFPQAHNRLHSARGLLSFLTAGT